MTDLILELTVMVSLAIIVYLMAAAVPRVEEEMGEERIQRTSLPLDKLDSFLVKFKDKLLRRTKILLMRIDNLISRQLRTKKP
ncbi:MAG: hypothetical protein PHV43_00070 [Candidatus Colwellbacteria bacterium]|nr:hypothetical protein [Candidatus Colwellbacteria bacterium]